MKKLLRILVLGFFILLQNTSYAAKKNLLDGDWVLNKQTNCKDPILKLTIKKNKIKAGKLKGKVNIKKNNLKLGKDLTGTFSSNFSIQLSSKTSECVYEFTKKEEWAASFGEIILSDEAKEMFDDHVEQSELLKVSLPSDNRVIKDYERFKDYRKNHLANNWRFTSYLWKENILGLKDVSKGQILTKDFCMKMIAEFKVPTTGAKEKQDFNKCSRSFSDYAVVNFDDGIQLYKELILKIVTAKKDKWTYKNSGKDDFNPRDYQLWGTLAPITMFYAVNYEELNYTKEENKKIQQYLKNKAMIERLDRDGNRSRRNLCPITDPMKLNGKKHKVNNCGSVRLRFAAAELALAIVMQDQELWAKGLWDLDYTLSMIEKEGFFVPLSAKGCKALGYTWDTSKLFSLNVEMLKLADFNLLDYKTRHGKTVGEAYEMLFKQYEDITISNHIAKKGIGGSSCGTKPYKTHEKFLFQQFDFDQDRIAEAVKENQIPTHEDFMNWSIRFVSEKHPEWLEGKYTLRDIKVYRMMSTYYFVQAIEIFNANIMSESHSIWQEKLKEFEQKKIEAISKLYIFEFEGETFNLVVDKVDFIETRPFELERSEEYLQPYQLHKAHIKGILKPRSDNNKKIDFRTLVFKHAGTKEQKLVIHVDDPTMKSLKRHSDSLQKKCGSELVNEWGWLSFISETNDMEMARNQQCHYDYFKKADDKEAWGVFQAVLGGTNSILDYLQTNIKR